MVPSPIFRKLSIFVYVSTFVTYGVVYTFTELLPLVKIELGINQKEIDFAGTAYYFGSNFFGYFSAGHIVEYLPKPLVVAMFGSLQPICQLLIGLTAMGFIHIPWFVFSLFYTFLGFSQGVMSNVITQQLLFLFPPSHTPFAITLTSLGHALGGLVFSLVLNLVSLSSFFTVVVSLQLIFTCLSTIFFIAQSGLQSQVVDEENTPLLTSEKPHSEDNDYTPIEIWKQLIRDPNYFICVFCTGTFIGSGTALITNIGNIAESLKVEVAQSAILTNLAQFVGRAGVSTLFAFFTWKTDTIDIALTLVGFYIAIFISFISIDEVSSAVFSIFTLLFGVAYGAGWNLIGQFTRYTVRPEAKYWKVVCGGIYPSNAIVTSIFNYIIGQVYDSQVEVGDTQCFGMKCYRQSFMIVGGCGVACGLFLLVLRSRTLSGGKSSKIA